MHKPTLYLIRGVSGAGKSTFAQRLWEAGVVERVFEADDWFYAKDGVYQFNAAQLNIAHKTCQQNTRFCLNSGKSVAVSNTSTTAFEVMVYQQIAEECNAHFISVIVENRHNGVNIHNVPEDKIKQMKERFSVKL
jgi:adenylate kinase family enzyme